MNINQLVRIAKLAAPELESLSDEKSRNLLQTVFKVIREEIDVTSEGNVVISMLGHFHVRSAVGEKDGQTISIKRISFRPATPKGAA